MMMDLTGMVLGDRYEILDLVGSGGMANVYKAKCRLLNRFVAVKILKEDLVHDGDFIKRFQVEAQAAAALSHPNIVNIYDVGCEGDIHYIVMELLCGMTLQEYIETNGKLDWREAIRFSMKIAGALECAHKNNIVHRDIKPHNIIVTEEGAIKVTDFGIARANTGSGTTRNVDTMGSVHYFSPEQARGGYSDSRSDLYSLGVTMYQMLTGILPFEGDTPVAIAIKHIQQEPVPPKEFNVAMPLALEEIVLKAMCKDQEKRYQTAAELIADLRAVDDGKPLPRPESEQKPDNTRVVDTGDVNKELERRKTPEKPKKPAKQTDDRKTVIAAVVTSVILVAALIWGAVAILFPGDGIDGDEMKVPNLVGKLLEDVQEQYTEEQIELEIIGEEESDKPTGTILDQSPKANTMYKMPIPIRITISKSEEAIRLSNYAGKELSAVKLELRGYGITVKEEAEDNDTVPQGMVIRTEPGYRAEVMPGDTVTVYYSNGAAKKKFSMPKLVDLSLHKAKLAIADNNLREGEMRAVDSELPENTVISQDPAVGEEVEEYTEVSLTYSNGKGGSSSSSETSVNTRLIRIKVPSDRESTLVTVYQNGSQVYNKIHAASDGMVDIQISGSGTQKVDIYYDGQYQSTQEVTL